MGAACTHASALEMERFLLHIQYKKKCDTPLQTFFDVILAFLTSKSDVAKVYVELARVFHGTNQGLSYI